MHGGLQKTRYYEIKERALTGTVSDYSNFFPGIHRDVDNERSKSWNTILYYCSPTDATGEFASSLCPASFSDYLLL